MLPDPSVRIVVATRPVDFRRGHDALAATAAGDLGLDIWSGVIVIFRSKRGDRLKMLAWDGTGLVLTYKRLECQSALKFDPRSACNIDPPEWHGGGCPGSQQGGPARLRVAPCATRSEAARGVPVGPPGQPGRGDGRRRVRSGS